MTPLVSPLSGLPLREERSGILTAGSERWPVLDGIPYLRTGRDALVSAMLAALDAGDPEDALVLALADQDAWWDGPAPSESDRRRLVRERDTLSLRQAMDLLALGRVADYFAHRWSDPTYLAGLALLDAHWAAPSTAFELACGIGHYLRDLSGRGVTVAGGDVAFCKLWLCRHWVCPEAALVCFDAASPWPIAGRRYDLGLCHDGLYFLEPKRRILDALRVLVRPGGVLAIAHVHNREADNLSAGLGVTAAEIRAWCPDAAVYDDAELTRAAIDGRRPDARSPADLGPVEAFSLAEGGAGRPGESGLLRPREAARLRLNPLYREAAGEAVIAWPTDRYRREYEPRATYRPRLAPPLAPTPERVRRREFLDLPERW